MLFWKGNAFSTDNNCQQISKQKKTIKEASTYTVTPFVDLLCNLNNLDKVTNHSVLSKKGFIYIVNHFNYLQIKKTVDLTSAIVSRM